MPGSADETEPTANGDDSITMHDAAPDNSSVPKPKRLACMICRKRKLKCDGLRPSCSTCSRLGHACAYDEQRRKSGPKRGYVKALEERLKQVETLLKTQDPVPAAPTQNTNSNAPVAASTAPSMPVTNAAMGMPGDGDIDQWQRMNGESPQPGAMDDFNFNGNMSMPMSNVDGNFTWEMIGLGLEEPLPPQETIDELHQIYFDKVHPSMPMIHRYRYMAAMNLAPNQRPPVCLRYAMWTLASCITEKYADLKDLFYQRARKYVEADYIKGFGEHMISVAHCQAHILLAAYEMRMIYFPRAWINTGSAVRLAQMIGLHRLDGIGLDVKQCLPPAKDWTEREERRRTFWMAFCEDRYTSIGTGWPMSIDERDIMTNMPCSDEAFDLSRPEQTPTLQESCEPSGPAKLSPFGGIVLMACLFGRNLVHLHRPDEDDLGHDLNGPFWKRHRQMDGILLNTSLGLPSHLKLPAGLSVPNVIFTNMSLHTATICLHQAAIFKADKNKVAASVSSESKVRCITAANEIASIMRTISHMDLAGMNPFIAFCLYVAARVFVQYLKSRSDDVQTVDSLRFLISAMHALKRRNPLTETFLVQLEVDFEALAARVPKLRGVFSRHEDSPGKDRNGELCTDREGVQGIMSYRGEYNFQKGPGEDEVPVVPGLVEPHNDGTQRRTSNAATTFSGAQQPWLGADQPIHVLTPSSGSTYDRNGSASGGYGEVNGESNDASLSPPDGSKSNGRTPISSNSGGSEPKSHLAAAASAMNGTTRDQTYPGRPMASPQGMMNPGMGAGGQNFYGAAGGFAMPQGMAAQPAPSYGIPNGGAWPDMSGQNGQPGMTPVGEGVLRALMNMGPMDAMDLSSWDSGHDNIMRG